MATYANKRNDAYGGTIENQIHFPLDIIRKVRKRVGFDYTISFHFPADEFVPGGSTIEDTEVIAVMLEKAGVDMISVSATAYDSDDYYISLMDFPTACLANLAAEIKSVVNIQVMATNRNRDSKVAENCLRQVRSGEHEVRFVS